MDSVHHIKKYILTLVIFQFCNCLLQDRQWCLCGNESNVDLARTEPVSESECDTPCNGNLSQICGGRYRISLYRITTVSRKTGILFTETC